MDEAAVLRRPEKFDAQADALGLKLAENFNAVITVNSNLDEGVLAGADPKRQAARAKVAQPVAEAFLKRKVRDRSRSATDCIQPLARQTLRDDGRRAGEDVLGGRQRGLREPRGTSRTGQGALAGGSEIQIKDSNGTDLRVRVQGRPVYASDGIISSEEAQKGGAAVSVYLPAGEVYVTPVAGTAEGKVVRPKEILSGAGNTEPDVDLCGWQADLDDRVGSWLRADEGAVRCGRGGQGPVRRG